VSRVGKQNKPKPPPSSPPLSSLSSRRANASPKLRGRVWIEIAGRAALTDAGADLLDQIAACGSLSEAARRLRFSYRRAWMLIDGMNRRWPKQLVTTAVGGERGGGTRITELGQVVLRSYRDVQIQVEHALKRAEDGFAKATRSRGG
jgi:molybdate transport system regulatory protein